MNERNYRNAFLILLVVVISAAFVAMIRQFLLTILLASIFSGLTYPLYARLCRLLGGRRVIASIATLVLLALVVGGPLLTFLGVLVSQAIGISEAVGPWIGQQIQRPDALQHVIDKIPGIDKLAPYRQEILTRAGQLVGAAGNFMVASLSTATRGTVTFLFNLFLLVYTMFYLFMDGGNILRRILYYFPLPDEDEARMVEKFLSVSRATLKGTVVIGVIQGTLSGTALAVAGIHGAVFWGTMMTVLSIIPGVGTALVWAPAAIYLAVTGRLAAAIMLTVFCTAVVGSVDNFVRPRLVGRDTEMHDLLILFSTLGGLFLFGIVGFIVGPILAALFVTIWEIYGVAFRDVLPHAHREDAGAGPGGDPAGGV